jgi:hypothetical protein
MLWRLSVQHSVTCVYPAWVRRGFKRSQRRKDMPCLLLCLQDAQQAASGGAGEEEGDYEGDYEGGDNSTSPTPSPSPSPSGRRKLLQAGSN